MTKRSLINYLITFFLVGLLTLINLFRPESNQTRKNLIQQRDQITPIKSNSVKVARVIDGDTIVLQSGEKVRYIGINSPELHDQKKPVQCFARQAAKKNSDLVLNKYVRLQKDVSNTDRYGRLLRYVYLSASPSAEIFVNAILVEEGFAQMATFPPDVAYAKLFLKLQQDAQTNSKGLWKACNK